MRKRGGEEGCILASREIVLIVEYDGTRYYGFQLQANQTTVQGEIEEALRRLTGERHRVMAASRTDTGVHAKGQVVSFRTESALSLQTFVKGLNYYLADDIAVKEAFRASDSFNVRRDAISREYNYYILNSLTRSPLRQGFCHLVSGELNIKAMDEASQVLIGKHDFASFAPESEKAVRDTVREVYQAGARREGDLVIFNVVANSFLRHQVRNTVGALIQVGQGKMTIDKLEGVLEARTPGLAGPRAPACGLCLTRVNYPAPLGEMFDGDAE